MSFITVIY